NAEETGLSISSLVCKACFGTCSLEISKRIGRDEISNPGPIILGQSSQRADCTGVCRPFRGSQAMILGSTPAVRRTPPRQTGVRRTPPRQTGGLCRGVRWKPD
ncbi:unnamed protein product, partial [Staurois parvus]